MQERSRTDILDDLCSISVLTLMGESRPRHQSISSSSKSDRSTNQSSPEHELSQDDISRSSPCLMSMSSSPVLDGETDVQIPQESGYPQVNSPSRSQCQDDSVALNDLSDEGNTEPMNPQNPHFDDNKPVDDDNADVKDDVANNLPRWMVNDSESSSDDNDEDEEVFKKNNEEGAKEKLPAWMIASDSESDDDQATADQQLFHSSDSEANETHQKVQELLEESKASPPNSSVKEDKSHRNEVPEEDGGRGEGKDDLDLDLDGLNEDEGIPRMKTAPPPMRMQVTELTRDYVINMKQSLSTEMIMAEKFFDIDSGHLATVICAMLNSRVGGNIFIGVKTNGLIRGVKLDRHKRDKVS